MRWNIWERHALWDDVSFSRKKLQTIVRSWMCPHPVVCFRKRTSIKVDIGNLLTVSLVGWYWMDTCTGSLIWKHVNLIYTKCRGLVENILRRWFAKSVHNFLYDTNFCVQSKSMLFVCILFLFSHCVCTRCLNNIVYCNALHINLERIYFSTSCFCISRGSRCC